MMHLGTNDVWSNLPAADIVRAFDAMVDWMRESNAGMKILVSFCSAPTQPPCLIFAFSRPTSLDCPCHHKRVVSKGWTRERRNVGFEGER